ncbi:atrial natriuretic peptide receptor 1-like [Patiria miniata]|uniref:Guanylate cyclase n=1 Tax=Patiria miniata TaxID=46514 RepID=A0A913YZY6_PATMI|nr:atrial natriuretic peptide receptor 1-like [Patiria miniata]
MGSPEPFDRVQIQPAIDVALETVKRRVDTGAYWNFSISYEYRSTGEICSQSNMIAPAIASELYYRNDVRVFFGPGCSLQCISVVDLASQWNTPVLSGAAVSGVLDDKTHYRTLTRTAFRTDALGRFAVALFRKWSWSRCSIVWSEGDLLGLYKLTGENLMTRFQKAGIDYIKVIHETGASTQDVLLSATERARIIILLTPFDVQRDIMVMAYRAGFINGQYAFLSLHYSFVPGDPSWKQVTHVFFPEVLNLKNGNASFSQGDGFEEEAKRAYEALMTFRLFEPSNKELNEFEAELERRRQRDFNWTSPPGEQYNFFTGTFHDAVILFSLAVNETLGEHGNLSDGYLLTRKMWNRTFDGIAGKVSLNENGDRDYDFSLWDMTDTDNGNYTIVWNFYGATGELEFVDDIVWPGGATGPPADTPTCGFDNENPACQPDDPTVTLTATIIVACSILIVGSIAILLLYRKLKWNAELKSRSWQIKWEELTQNEYAQGQPHSSTFSIGSSSMKTEEGKQIFTKTSYYQGRTVAVKMLAINHVDLNKNLLIELKQMRDLEHPNLARFIGMCLDVPNVAIINEYCSKGSLMDILQNESIKLDWLFKYSLISDIIKGVQYLHRSDFAVHGRLNSSNCLVDGRFVLKLVDFGLHTFRERVVKSQNSCHAAMTKSFWVAPELLRDPSRGPTKEGDIYSVGIIMRDVLTREGPYDTESKDMDVTEIVEKIKYPPANGSPFRPQWRTENDDTRISDLFQACWAEDPTQRPTANSLNTIITKINRESSTGTCILDNLLHRMEQYANNLEELVSERTAAFLEEKKRAETLLYELLPRIVADRLKEGKAVDPESYDSVTIFFSDIKGFTELSAQSTPMQVVTLLNDLYTCFDRIIGHFDVYKIETIGDAYMVVSGVPVRNGNAHAREIANMALALIQEVDSFTIRHKRDRKLQLRVGIHTGPCVAGVVGLKMPRYCLFGDTVNTASRMESTGEAMKIHISSETRAVLDSFDCFFIKLRGDIEIKGKGTHTTFWLQGKIESPA